ncbi:hypothetical protein MG293_007991 [Ovis ammon polii]|uniref:Uncharacterized protein n=1 Tax=Ovis ammon polii TaxID=230172 RepID=A0AAD4U9S5_OVIAM|nr:hypothetical protein MG293_007991 [Ovis ammon polii]
MQLRLSPTASVAQRQHTVHDKADGTRTQGETPGRQTGWDPTTRVPASRDDYGKAAEHNVSSQEVHSHLTRFAVSAALPRGGRERSSGREDEPPARRRQPLRARGGWLLPRFRQGLVKAMGFCV